MAAGLSAAVVRTVLETAEARSQHRWLHVGGPGYPEGLNDLPAPPPVLWLTGDAEALRGSGLAVVGSRRCTSYGRSVAEALGKGVAHAGGVLVSGAARGIDTAAHLGALRGAGRTVAVLGAGLDAWDSAGARKLLSQIVLQGGAVVSEMPPGDPATRWTFPRRNRLIAAMAVGTVVVEAAARSGARYTATAARELGRELFAVPGRIDAPASAGTLRLLQEGASCLTRLADAVALVTDPSRAALPEALAEVLVEPRMLGEICSCTGLSVRDVLRLMSTLEIKGVVERLPDRRYQLISAP